MRGKASFMIMLVLTLPFLSALAYADITVVYAGGQDGYNGYLRGNDNIRIDVRSDNPTVVFSDSPSSRPFNCIFNSTTSKYDCSLKPTSSLPTTHNDIASYVLSELDPDTNPISSKSVIMKVDNAAPLIESFRVYQDANDGKIKTDLDIKEIRMSSDTSGNSCSGIKKARILSATTEPIDLEITTSPNDCVVSMSGVDLGITTSGEYRFALSVEDNLGNSAVSEEVIIYYDAESPTVLAGTIKFIDSATQEEVTLVSTEADPSFYRSVFVTFQINDRNLDPASVKADLSELTNTMYLKSVYADVSFDCSSENDYNYVCVSEEVSGGSDGYQLNPSSGVVEIRISASDTMGYSIDNQAFTKVLSEDNVRPVVDLLGTTYCSRESGQCYAKERTDFKVEILSGSKTFTKKLVSLNLGRVNYNDRWVDSCEETGSSWICLLSYPVTLEEGGPFEVRLGESYDDIGNIFEDASSIIIYDSEPPYFDESEEYFEAMGGGHPWVDDGDQITFKLKVHEDTSCVEEAYANFSRLSQGYDNVATDCRHLRGNEYECVWNSVVRADSTGMIPVYFDIYDCAGNLLEYESEVEVLTVSEDSRDFWRLLDDSVIPEKVDLVTLPYFPLDYVSVFVTKELDGNTPGARSLSLDFLQSTECVSNDPNATKAFRDATIFRATKPYQDEDKLLFEVQLNKVDIPNNDNLEYTCPIMIISASNGVRYQGFEMNMTFTIPTYTSQYKAGEELKNKIEDLKSDLESQMWIDDMMGLIEMIQQMCQVWNTANTIYTGISAAFAIAAEVLNWNPPAKMGVCTADFGIATVFEGIGTFINNLCNFADCSLVPKFITERMTSGDEDMDTTVKEIIIFAVTGLSTDQSLAKLRGELVGSYWDIAKKSMLYSILLLCIPGVLYNLKQKRNIDCKYVYCLENQVVEQGMQPYVCEGQKAYATCIFVYGQFYNSMPFSILLQMFASIIRLFAQNPVAVIGMILNYGCKLPPVCAPTGGATLNAACAVTHVISKINALVSAVQAFSGIFSGDIFELEDETTDYCSMVLEDDD